MGFGGNERINIKFCTFAFLFFSVYLLSVDASAPELEGLSASSNLTELWPIYKNEHNKSYDADEDKERFLIFQENAKTIVTHNEKYKNGEESYFMGLNQFADLKPDELKKRQGLLRPEAKN